MIKVGVIGSGFISKGFYLFSLSNKNFKISNVLTRTKIKSRVDWPNSLLTNDLERIIKNSDIILECSGDVLHSSTCINEILKNNIPVVTLNSEFHITTGFYFYSKGIVVEAEGDQTGCFYKLNSELIDMGLSPIVYGNYKKYLNYNVSLKQAKHWSNKNNISLDKTIAFTDGSKVEIENVFTANALDAYFLNRNKHKNKVLNIINESFKTNKKYVDFFVNKNYPAGIFIATKCDPNQKNYLKYLGFKDNHQIIERPYHLCHLEIFKTIKDVLQNNKKDFMINKFNRYMAASITKKPLKKNTILERGLGSLEIRGIHYKYCKSMVPITLLNNMRLKYDVPENHLINFNDVEYEGNFAIDIWRNCERKIENNSF
jgi:predicted homoserine dehydrogenase-like protein